MRVLVPMDYGELSEEALRTTCSLHPDADIRVLHVIDFRNSDPSANWSESPGAWDDFLAEAHDHADRLFERARAIADEYDVRLSTDTAVGETARTVLDDIDDHDIDLVVMGSHGRSLPARVLLGSVSETVVRRAPVPVLVVR